MSLPTWESVIGYEEGDSSVHDHMRAGYPRFFIHPITRQLFEKLESEHCAEGERLLAYSTVAAAERAREFVRRRSECEGRVLDEKVGLLIVPEAGYQAAREYWQHSGEIVGSRQAEDLLADRSVPAGDIFNFRGALAEVLEVPAADTFIFESGMAAIFTLYRIATKRAPGKKTLQLSFPYVDALKVQEHFGAGVDFVNRPVGEELKSALTAIRSGSYAAVFCEVPSNPLLNTVELASVSQACRDSGTLLLVDDTICSHRNIAVLPFADAVSTSLTKWVSGFGDLLAGAARVNRESPFASLLRKSLECEVPDGSRLYARDAEVLTENSKGFTRRVAESNTNGLVVTEFLSAHPAIDRVWHPTLVDRAEYDALRRSDGGYGGLLSFTLKNPARIADVYRALRFSKGPSLGTEYSLICPYPMLAHYNEMAWATGCGVPRELLRFSVGREPLDELKERLEEALKQA